MWGAARVHNDLVSLIMQARGYVCCDGCAKWTKVEAVVGHECDLCPSCAEKEADNA